MKLRNRKQELESNSKSQESENEESDISSGESDSESDDDLLDLAKKIGSAVGAEIEQPQKSEKMSNNPLFVMDRTAGQSTSANTVIESEPDEDSESDEEEVSKKQSKLKAAVKKSPKKKSDVLSSSLQTGINLNDVYINTDPDNNPYASLHSAKSLLHGTSQIEKEILCQSVITPDFEKKHQIPTYQESLNQIKKKRREERSKTKGNKWFNMKAPEMTEEKKNDLMVLQWRRALDPKHFLKAPDTKAAPKFFQMGKVVEDHTDYYSARIPKKQRKANLVEELMADAEFRNYNKRKYAEIVESKKHKKGAYRHMKRMKKRK